jgi:exodeoxyribonuclease VII large subunit
MFKPKSSWLRFKPADGMQVLVRARVGLYEPRGEFQLVAEHMEPAGEGALQREFERLKAQLDAEGLFAQERKRALPRSRDASASSPPQPARRYATC